MKTAPSLAVKTEKPKNKKTEKPKKEKKVKDITPKKWPRFLFVSIRAVGGSLALIVILFSGAAYAYQDQFKGLALYGTKILGEDVGGKTEAEIRRVIEKKSAEIKISFKIEGADVSASPEEAGFSFNIKESAKRAVEKGRTGKILEDVYYTASSLLHRISPFVAEAAGTGTAENLELVYKVDDEQLSLFTGSLSDKFDEESKDVGLVTEGTEVTVVPAVYGRKIFTGTIKSQLATAIKTGRSAEIKIDAERVPPEILEEDTKDSITAAKKIIETPVSFTYEGKKFSPAKDIIGGWIVFKETELAGNKTLVPEVNPRMVYSYIYSIAGEINLPAVNKKVKVINGKEQRVESEGKDGLAVDVDLASVKTATALNGGNPVEFELPTYSVKHKTTVNNVVVANWAKYISVDISEQKMCAYLAGGTQVNCWAITTGQRGLDTPVGTHIISRKSGAGGRPGAGGGGVCMPNPPSRTPLCGINYVSTFTAAGHAVHEAWWRTTFGTQSYIYSGSHGCVNAPYNVAKFIYDWAPIGTPVIIQK